MKKILAWAKQSWGYLWLVLFAIYFVILTGQAVWRNYQAQQNSKNLEAQAVVLEQQKEQLQALIVYYQTDDFKEKALRQELLLQMPNEKVFSLPESGLVQKDTAGVALSTTTETPDDTTSLPIWEQWLEYLFSPKTNS